MGYIQSIQSFSAVDGPGTRCVVFFQGCPVKCVFCHNPDAWKPGQGAEIDVEEVMRGLDRFSPFLHAKGLTLSGGEPLFQPEFALALARAAGSDGWHVALDTSGWGPEDLFEQVVRSVDLVMFSVKHPIAPERVAHGTLDGVEANLARLASLPVPVWLRYVLISGWTDEPGALTALAAMAKKLPNLQRIEILPFNSLAKNKWAKLGLENPLFWDAKTAVSEAQIEAAEKLLSGRP
jgi:pyruvate formate lyase activating enzyme